jgi:hypothetical protein
MANTVWSKIKQDVRTNGTPVTVRSESFNKIRTNTPDFLKKTKLGMQLPQNAYSFTYTLGDKPIFISHDIRNSDKVIVAVRRDIFSDWTPGTYVQTVGTLSETTVQNAALDAFWANASGQNANYGQIFAEGRQTLNLVTNTAVKIAKCVKSLRRLDVWGAFDALGLSKKTKHFKDLRHKSKNLRKTDYSHFVSSSFLEMEYGWKPLLSDVYDVAKDLAYRNAQKSYDVTIRGSAVAEAPVKYVLVNGPSAPPATLNICGVGKNLKTLRVTYSCRYRVASPALRTASALGLTNPLYLGWQLVPFSFVVDWFTPIGAYLESLSALQGLSFIDGTRSVLTLQTSGGILTGRTGVGGNGRFISIQGAGQEYNQSVSLVRVVLTGSPGRPGPFRLSPDALGTNRPLKALALLRTAFGR